jgi:hypothetical protein
MYTIMEFEIQSGLTFGLFVKHSAADKTKFESSSDSTTTPPLLMKLDLRSESLVFGIFAGWMNNRKGENMQVFKLGLGLVFTHINVYFVHPESSI